MGLTRPLPQPEVRWDWATGLSQGDRPAQEDAVLCDVPPYGGPGLMLLADGLGGHAAGAVASHLAVATAHGALAKARAGGTLEQDIPGHLRAAAKAANQAILRHAQAHPETQGMGTTLILVVVLPSRIFWLSIGDSPLYLLRGAAPVQLNETHSLAAQLDLLVRAGELPALAAANHPDRHCLTSALGGSQILQIDCPDHGFPLAEGDVLLAASDGILTLSPEAVQTEALGTGPRPAQEMVQSLLDAVARANRPNQDNLGLALVQPLPVTLPSAALEALQLSTFPVHPGWRARRLLASVLPPPFRSSSRSET